VYYAGPLTQDEATTCNQAAYVYLRTGRAANRDEAYAMARAMMAEELAEWSDMSKDMYGYRVRTLAGLADVRATYWAQRYASGGAVPCY
jgi:hypothetical protein